MASNFGVQKTNLNSVLSWYNNQEESNFSIYRGIKENDSFFCDGYNGGDKGEGMNALQRILNEIEPHDFNIYFLKLHSSNVKSKKVTPGITFQLYSAQRMQQIAGYDPMQQQAMNEILSEIRALRSERMEAMIQEQEEEEEEDPQEQNQGILAGILNNPQIAAVMQNVLMNLAGSLMGAKPQVNAVSGIQNETATQDLTKSLEILFSKGVTPQDIEKLAAMEQGQINFLLSMLRK